MNTRNKEKPMADEAFQLGDVEEGAVGEVDSAASEPVRGRCWFKVLTGEMAFGDVETATSYGDGLINVRELVGQIGVTLDTNNGGCEEVVQIWRALEEGSDVGWVKHLQHV
jgi:hypothetical protein